MSATTLADPGLLAPADRRRRPRVTRALSIGIPAVFFGAFFVGPLTYLVLLSFWRVENFRIVSDYGLGNYLDVARNFVSGSNYGFDLAQSLYVAATTACVSVVLCYFLALAIVFAVPVRHQRLAILLGVSPFWTSYILRVYAWQVLLARRGVINSALSYIGLDQLKVGVLYTQVATRIGLLHYLAPVLLVILYTSLATIDRTVIEAARELGATRRQILARVIVPLSRTGIVLSLSFATLVTCGDVLSPSILGGGAGASLIGKLPMFAETIIRAYTSSTNLPGTAALAVVLVVAMLAILAVAFAVTERLRIPAG